MRATKVITAVEAHAEGEGGRVITAGLPQLKGASVKEKMLYMYVVAWIAVSLISGRSASFRVL